MPVYNLLYYSENFRKTTGSFWNYHPDKPNSMYTVRADVPINERERKKIFRSIRNSESFDYKTKFINVLPAAADLDNGNDVGTESEDIKIIIPLKNLSAFITSLNFLMINTEIELILKWNQNFVLTGKATREQKDAVAAHGGNPGLDEVDEINRPKDLKFRIKDCKLYVPVVTLQEKYDN